MQEREELLKQVEELRKREQELQIRNEELTDFMENASLPLHWVDSEGTIIWANQAELDSLGYSEEEYIGKKIADFHADPEVIADILKRLSHKQTLRNYPARLKCKDGSLKHVLINSNVLFKDGKFIHTRCFTRDVTELKKEEERKNRLLNDLNKFSYITSHDLKAPLRGISSLTEMLEDEYSSALDEKGKEYLRLIRSRVNRMYQLIEGILNYSRASTASRMPERIDVRKMVVELAAGLSTLDKKIDVKVQEGMPSIKGTSLLTKQVFQNLLDNSIRHSDKEMVEITVGFNPGTSEFFVCDNGPGIDRKYHEKIFEMFQTLGPRENGETTGVGLALVKLIVDGEGGKVRLESKAGKGTCFYLTLPVVTHSEVLSPDLCPPPSRL